MPAGFLRFAASPAALALLACCRLGVMRCWPCPAGSLLAAERDVGNPCGYPELCGVGWDLAAPYFNSGLLLLDLQVSHCPFVGSRAACSNCFM
jgi:hypothetical protein